MDLRKTFPQRKHWNEQMDLDDIPTQSMGTRKWSCGRHSNAEHGNAQMDLRKTFPRSALERANAKIEHKFN